MMVYIFTNYYIEKLFIECFKSKTVILNILCLFSSVDKMVQGVWSNKLMPRQYKMC